MLRAALLSLTLIAAADSNVDGKKGTEQDTDGTHWIWLGSSRPKRAPVNVAKRFSTGSNVTSATVRCHTDFCDAIVTLNGVQVLVATPYDELPMADVTRHVRPGENDLAVRAVGNGGPAAVAVELAITLDSGTTQLVRSNTSWESADGRDLSPIVSRGRADQEPWWHINERPSVNSFDEYNQWEEALGTNNSELRASFQMPRGFEMDLVRRARNDEGSWISLTMDPQGRFIIGKEEAGIIRLTLPNSEEDTRIEVINDRLRGCHGLLWAHDSLYVNASESKALFRLRDTDADDQLDEVLLLKRIPGGGGDHGRNGLIAGPGGEIYLVHGDAVRLPELFRSLVPATSEFGDRRRPRGGHLIRTDPDGETWQVVAAGLRNPYGVDVNEDGELFTYDADAERHTGLPWYRPTRMYHLVSGADYGWRGDDSLWPMYYPDSLPPNSLVGRGSPTSVMFATASSFPPSYRRALFALDWAYGRVFAVHVVPRGASYSMHVDTFLRGRPFNVVDLEFGRDGSMYLITGGYKTRSALYRVRYVGPPVDDRQLSPQEEARRAYSQELRRLRRRLETLHRPDAREAVEMAWPYLDHPDRWIRHAARVAIEHQPASLWGAKLREESRPERVLPALLALVRVGPNVTGDAVREWLGTLALGELSTELRLTAVRALSLAESELPSRTPLAKRADDVVDPRGVLEQFEPLYPSGDTSLDRELCRLLAKRGSTDVVAKTLDILATEPSQQDRLHYLSVLAEARNGWTPARRTEYFRILRGARLSQGDEGMPQFVREIEGMALASAPHHERRTLIRLLAPDEPDTDTGTPQTARSFVKKWQLADLFPDIAVVDSSASIARGESLFREVLCSACHRLGTIGRAMGPDLTGLSARYSRREIIEAIVSPSKTVSSRYKNYSVVMNDGRVVTGQVVWNGFRKSILRIATDPMRMENVIEVSKSDIVSHQETPLSPMPEGLLDTLTHEEILDLLAFVESEGH